MRYSHASHHCTGSLWADPSLGYPHTYLRTSTQQHHSSPAKSCPIWHRHMAVGHSQSDSEPSSSSSDTSMAAASSVPAVPAPRARLAPFLRRPDGSSAGLSPVPWCQRGAQQPLTRCWCVGGAPRGGAGRSTFDGLAHVGWHQRVLEGKARRESRARRGESCPMKIGQHPIL